MLWLEVSRPVGHAIVRQEVAPALAERRRNHKPDLAKAMARLQAVEQELVNLVPRSSRASSP
jgi:hypothetical protein